jgi:hypothetical protein
MATAMRYRDVERALLANNCTWKLGKGDHIKWHSEKKEKEKKREGRRSLPERP